MEIPEIVTVLMILLCLGLFVEPLARWVRLPYSMMLVTVGFIFSEIFTGLGYDTGIRGYNFYDVIFFVLLPALVFESAYQTNVSILLKNSGVILFLAIFGMLFTALATAAGLFYGIGHPSGFPWEAALLAGALLAATDPVAVVAQLKQLGAPERLEMLLEGESLFNDATAIVIFSVILSLALMPGDQLSLSDVAKEFGRVFFGGAVIGVMVGCVGVALQWMFSGSMSQRLLTLIAAYSAFLLAEKGFHVSGVIATLMAGLGLAWGSHRFVSASAEDSIHDMWELIGHIATSLVFLVMGITIYLAMFQERWLAMVIAIGSVLVARILSIYVALPIATVLSRNPIPKTYRPVMVWGGLRGAVTIALAFSIPQQLDYWWTVQSIAFGVVIFTLFVQAPTCGLLIKRALAK